MDGVEGPEIQQVVNRGGEGRGFRFWMKLIANQILVNLIMIAFLIVIIFWIWIVLQKPEDLFLSIIGFYIIAIHPLPHILEEEGINFQIQDVPRMLLLSLLYDDQHNFNTLEFFPRTVPTSTYFVKGLVNGCIFILDCLIISFVIHDPHFTFVNVTERKDAIANRQAVYYYFFTCSYSISIVRFTMYMIVVISRIF